MTERLSEATMDQRDPLVDLDTHRVENQPQPLPGYDLYRTDPVLTEQTREFGQPWTADWLSDLGRAMGSEEAQRQGFEANENPPQLRAFDRYGRRIDQVEYHPSYHALMAAAIGRGVHSIAWREEGAGGHLAHIAAMYLITQPEQGFCCPITMTHSVIPALRHDAAVAAEWEPRILENVYDSRFLPPAEKRGVTFGMAMTEKQGGSDVRANTTRAEASAEADVYTLTGHKWFCSAPMSDAFLTLAQTEEGLTCFLVPRWRPDGSRNPFQIQRLKDKLGNRSNASSEIEYAGTWARRLGEPGRGVRTIIEMVQQTRLDAATAPPGMMRQGLVQAYHHVSQRKAFGARLIDQPLMRNVLADLALEWEAATQLVLRVARAVDDGHDDQQSALFARLATAVTKYWTNKRTPQFLYECMECLGGGGYVEESILPRLYREAPVNSIWEGSGNVICLDVLRAVEREPETVPAMLREIERGAGRNEHLDRYIEQLKGALRDDADPQVRARRLTESMALALQGSLMVRFAPEPVAEAFCLSRLTHGHSVYGTLPPAADLDTIIARIWQD